MCHRLSLRQRAPVVCLLMKQDITSEPSKPPESKRKGQHETRHKYHQAPLMVVLPINAIASVNKPLVEYVPTHFVLSFTKGVVGFFLQWSFSFFAENQTNTLGCTRCILGNSRKCFSKVEKCT